MQFVNQRAMQFHHHRNKTGLRSAEGSNVSETREHPQLEARPKPEHAAAADRLRTSNAKPKDEQFNSLHV